jgi:hypothetical protein
MAKADGIWKARFSRRGSQFFSVCTFSYLLGPRLADILFQDTEVFQKQNGSTLWSPI